MKLQGGTVPATGVGSASPIRMKHYETEEGRTCVCVCVCVCVRASMCMCVSKGGYEGELAGPCTRQRKEGHAVCVRVRTCAHMCVRVRVNVCVRGGTRGSWQVHVQDRGRKDMLCVCARMCVRVRVSVCVREGTMESWQVHVPPGSRESPLP